MIWTRGTGTIPSIAAIRRCTKLVFYSITTQHLIIERKFTSWNYFDSNCAQTRFEIIFFAYVLLE